MSDRGKKIETEEPADDREVPSEAPPVDPAELTAMRARAEGAERKLRDIQETFLAARAELEATRVRVERDATRKAEAKFGELVANLLECADDLDRAIEHGRQIPAASPVVSGVAIARDRFLGALTKAGLERIDPVGQPYDPNVAEAIGVVPVSDPGEHDVVVSVERAGFKLGSRILRPARVHVGRLLS